MAAKVPEGCPLTRREFEVMQRLGETGDYVKTAAALGISRSTIATHVHRAHRKLGVVTVAAAITVMGRRGWLGWITPDDPTPLANEHPWLAAYLKDFERSRWPHEPDARAIVGMSLALAGHRNTMKP